MFQDPFSSLNPRGRVGDSIDEPLRVHKLADGKQARATRESTSYSNWSAYRRRSPPVST